MSTVTSVGHEHIYSVGQWVRFYLSGRLVIARIEYLPPRASYESQPSYCTDLGEIPQSSIMEAR